jgi:hypothetical protein
MQIISTMKRSIELEHNAYNFTTGEMTAKIMDLFSLA